MLLMIMFAILMALPANTSSTDPTQEDRKDSNVVIEFMTTHTELYEGEVLNLRCVVNVMDNSDEEELKIQQQWKFVAGEDSSSELNDEPEVKILASQGALLFQEIKEQYPRFSVNVRRSWDAVTDFNVEEHYLTIERVKPSDQGIYICQVRNKSIAILK